MPTVRGMGPQVRTSERAICRLMVRNRVKGIKDYWHWTTVHVLVFRCLQNGRSLQVRLTTPLTENKRYTSEGGAYRRHRRVRNTLYWEIEKKMTTETAGDTFSWRIKVTLRIRKTGYMEWEIQESGIQETLRRMLWARDTGDAVGFKDTRNAVGEEQGWYLVVRNTEATKGSGIQDTWITERSGLQEKLWVIRKSNEWRIQDLVSGEGYMGHYDTKDTMGWMIQETLWDERYMRPWRVRDTGKSDKWRT